MSSYPLYIPLKYAKMFEFFDDIPYKYVKSIINKDNDSYFEVDIKDFPCEKIHLCKTQFTFTLEIRENVVINKEFNIIKEYHRSSHMADVMMNMRYDTDEETIEHSESSGDE
tara:strand:+ start:90 stop:425 length:336 start_codon:yes stop_codon:yes gene_type:complete